MTPVRESIPKHSLFKSLSYTVLFNTLIALFLTSVKFGHGFLTNFIFSQCIGLTICLCVHVAMSRTRSSRAMVQWLIIMGAMTLGSVGGTLIGALVAGKSPFRLPYGEYDHVIKAVAFGLLFGSIITYIFISRQRIAASESLVQEERIKRLANEKKAAETHLKMLQAQVEPHFLFNTLSNVLSLLETDLEKARHMLDDLIHYLRASLSRTRAESNTLAQEMELVRAYLNIQRVRMGERLRYEIQVPEELNGLRFPPMLIQPLVENAITHGLEPKIDGGEIWIRVRQTREVLRVEVVDTGLGFQGGQPGIGLGNLRERVKSLYGEKGRLILEENQPSGLKAVIEVTNHEPDKGHHSG